jgi:hypothetical protein
MVFSFTSAALLQLNDRISQEKEWKFHSIFAFNTSSPRKNFNFPEKPFSEVGTNLFAFHLTIREIYLRLSETRFSGFLLARNDFFLARRKQFQAIAQQVATRE